MSQQDYLERRSVRLLRFHLDAKQGYLDAHHAGLPDGDADLCRVCSQVPSAHLNEDDRLSAIAALHVPGDAGRGATTGFCGECEIIWPCPTWHWALGWNLDQDEEHWCPHAGVRL